MKTLYLKLNPFTKKNKIFSLWTIPQNLFNFFNNYKFFNLRFLMASSTSWEFYKEVETKILWVNICAQDLEGVAISINKWWKTKYAGYKIRIVSKKEFELVKMKAEKNEQNIFLW